jgi:hypothetical protein
LETFKRASLEEDRQVCFKENDRQKVEISELKKKIESQDEKIQGYDEQAVRYKNDISSLQE